MVGEKFQPASDEVAAALGKTPYKERDRYIRASEEQRELAQQAVAIMEANSGEGVAMRTYKHHSDAHNERERLRELAEHFSHRKVRTKIEVSDDIDPQTHSRNATLYMWFAK